MFQTTNQVGLWSFHHKLGILTIPQTYSAMTTPHTSLFGFSDAQHTGKLDNLHVH